MTTITLDILDDKAMNLLKDLEAMNVIKIQSNSDELKPPAQNLSAKYSGAMTKQPIEEIDKQLNEPRNEW